MRKLINSPENYVDEMLSGFVLAHPDLVRTGEKGRTITRRSGVRRGRVGIATGGGAGHLPLFAGYVGAGLVDSCAVGNVFEGPNFRSCTDTIKAADGGAGVLLLFANYGGDRMNFNLARKAADIELIETVLANDDVASAGPDEAEIRRGVAGIVFAFKTAGALAENGASLTDVAAIARRTIARTRTIGVGLKGCSLPGVVRPVVELPDDEVELGIGIHGEPGLWRKTITSADGVVEEMIRVLLSEKPEMASGRVALLVNGLGATPLEEQYIAYRRAVEILTEEGLEIASPMVGSFATSMEMAGISISLCFLENEMETLLAAPASSPCWRV